MTAPHHTGNELSMLQAGDRQTWERFYNTFTMELYAIAMRHVNDRETAKDLIHDTFVNTLELLHEPEITSVFVFKRYCRRMLLWLTRNHIRSAGRKRVYEASLAYERFVQHPDDPEWVHLKKHLAQLPAKNRHVLKLYYLSPLNLRQISSLLQMPYKTTLRIEWRFRKYVHLYNTLLSEAG